MHERTPLNTFELKQDGIPELLSSLGDTEVERKSPLHNRSYSVVVKTTPGTLHSLRTTCKYSKRFIDTFKKIAK